MTTTRSVQTSVLRPPSVPVQPATGATISFRERPEGGYQLVYKDWPVPDEYEVTLSAGSMATVLAGTTVGAVTNTLVALVARRVAGKTRSSR